MVDVFRLWSGSCLVQFLCSNLFISGIDYYMCRNVFDRSGSILTMCFVSVVFYSWCHGSSRMQRFCNSCPERTLLVMVLRLYEPLKLAESIVRLHSRLLRPSINLRPCLLCILHSSHVVDDAGDDSSLVARIITPKEVHLSSVRNGSNPLERFLVQVGTRTELLEWVLPDENLDRRNLAGFSTKNQPFQLPIFACN